MKPIIDLLFNLTVKVLLFIGKTFHLSYNAVNVIIWYMLIPLLWTAILDYKLHCVILTPAWLLLCSIIMFWQRKQLNRFFDKVFKLSQAFISYFGDYYKWSVIICLLLPIVITVFLLLA